MAALEQRQAHHAECWQALDSSVKLYQGATSALADRFQNEAAKHYEPPALAALLVQIAEINVWNRLNVAVRQVAGRWG